jgi:anhydro-N-acetylmuramic acid kinase
MLFQDPSGQIPRVVCNIGGISNITVLKKDFPLSGYDTGPGNTLIDAWTRHAFEMAYDENGEKAKSGRIKGSFLEALLADPYFSKAAPKSTGREYFHLGWAQKCLKTLNLTLSPHDMLATLTELTAKAIALETQKHLSDEKPAELILCGGGSHNGFLVERIKVNLPASIQVKSSNEFGVDPNLVEALGFAWLARQRVHLSPGNSPHTGAKSLGILGGLWQPA